MLILKSGPGSSQI